MNANPYDLIAAELCRLHEAEGPELWRNRIRLTGLLLDHEPDLRREIRSVVSGVEQGVAAALSETERSLSGIAIDRQASLLETESGLRSEVALNVTRTIAHALNLGPLPSVYGHAAPRAPAPLVNLERHHPPQPLPMPPHPPLPTPAPPQHWSDPRDPRHYSDPNAGRRSVPWAVVIIGSAVLIGGGVLTATLLPRGDANTAASAPSSTSAQAPATPTGDVALQLGQWEYAFTATAVEAPGAPAAVIQQAQSQIGQPQRRTQCVTTNDTTNMAQQLSTQLSASLGQQADCTLSRETFAQGRIDIAGTCEAPTGSLEMEITGNYTAVTSQTAITMNVTSNGQLVTIQGTETGRRTGECGG